MMKFKKIKVHLHGIGKQMLKKSLVALSATLFTMNVFANNTWVEMKTTLGTLEIELFNEQAPIAVKNFEHYVKTKFYTGTVFHRVIPGFMVQGGGMTVDMQEKPNTKAAIRSEANNGVLNKRGTLAMARTNDPDSAKSQFFINVVDNAGLDQGDGNAGYTVFGQVTKGMDIVDKMQQVPTSFYGGHRNVPRNPIKILSVRIKPAVMKNK